MLAPRWRDAVAALTDGWPPNKRFKLAAPGLCLGTLRTQADNMRDIASGNLKLTSVRYDSLTVRIYGDVAVLQGIADNAGTLRGLPFSGKIRYTRVFVRRAGQWQAVAMQQTSMQ